MKDSHEIQLSNGTMFKLRTPSAKEIDKFIEVMSKPKSGCWEASYRAFNKLIIPITQLNSEVLTEFLVGPDAGRWDYIMLKGYRNLLNGKCIVGNGEWIIKIVDPYNVRLDSDSIVNEFKEKLWELRHEFNNRMAEAKVILKSTFDHNHSAEIVDGYVKDWVSFSLGELPFMYDWEEIVKLVKVNTGRGIDTFRMLPRWLICILLRESWEVDSLSQWPEAIPELFEPVYAEEPEPNVERMKGDGRRKLITKNGFTFPSPKRRW